MTIAVIDRSPEAAHERYQAAQASFLATPCRSTGDVYMERFAIFYRRFNGSSVGLDAELEFLGGRIARAIREHEMRTGRAAE